MKYNFPLWMYRWDYFENFKNSFLSEQLWTVTFVKARVSLLKYLQHIGRISSAYWQNLPVQLINFKFEVNVVKYFL